MCKLRRREELQESQKKNNPDAQNSKDRKFIYKFGEENVMKCRFFFSFLLCTWTGAGVGGDVRQEDYTHTQGYNCLLLRNPNPTSVWTVPIFQPCATILLFATTVKELLSYFGPQGKCIILSVRCCESMWVHTQT